MLSSLKSDTFFGWKGGEFKYNDSDNLHFETDYGSYTDERFILNFLINHGKESIVKHIFNI